MALPTEADLRARLQLEDDDEDAGTLQFLKTITPLALEIVSGLSGVKFGSQTVTGEYPALRSYSPVVRLDRRPVTAISAVYLAGRALTVGTLEDVYLGKVDCAISPWTDGLQFARQLGCGDGRGYLRVNYTGGMETLPADLLEAFFTAGALIYREGTRVGETKKSVGESTTEYTRKLLTDFPMVGAACRRYQTAFAP